MKQPVISMWARRGPLIALGVGLLICGGSQALSDVTGPVVGFVRVEVTSESQWVDPPVRPWAPQTDAGETPGQALTDYLGEEFRSGPGANGADLIGFETEDGFDELSMTWRDTHGQWRDLAGEAVEPGFTGGFWLELKLDSAESGGDQTRELVLCGEAVW